MLLLSTQLTLRAHRISRKAMISRKVARKKLSHTKKMKS